MPKYLANSIWQILLLALRFVSLQSVFIRVFSTRKEIPKKRSEGGRNRRVPRCQTNERNPEKNSFIPGSLLLCVEARKARRAGGSRASSATYRQRGSGSCGRCLPVPGPRCPSGAGGMQGGLRELQTELSSRFLSQSEKLFTLQGFCPKSVM